MAPTPCAPSPGNPPDSTMPLQVGLLERGFHHRQNLGPKCQVCNWSLLQDLGIKGRGAGLAWGSQPLAPGKRQ